jgi:hypothetical protein
MASNLRTLLRNTEWSDDRKISMVTQLVYGCLLFDSLDRVTMA